MKLLFFSVTKHQYSYFEKLKSHLSFNSTHTFFPTLNISFKSTTIDSSKILNAKYKELDAKYTNALHKQLYKLLLKIQIPWVVRAIYKQLTLHKPHFLVVWNGKKFHQAIAVEVAKSLGIPSVYFENGVLPNTTTMDFRGVNANNSVPRNASFYEKLHFLETQKLPQHLVTREANRKKRTFTNNLPETYIFIPFQVAYDTQIIQHSPWIPDMFSFYEILEWLSSQTDTHFVIKEHPSDRVSDYALLHEKTNEKIHFSSQDTQHLIENATAIISINSSVVMESLLFSKRVIVLGEAFFAIEGVVKTAHSKEEILLTLQKLDDWDFNTSLVQKFLKYIYFDYLIADSWREPTDIHYEAIKTRFKEQNC